MMLSFSKPPLFQSKLLCFSLFYLASSVITAFFAAKCTFRSSPFDPLQDPFFFYPPSYGEHKHAIPTSRSSCDSPVMLSDYGIVVKEMRQLWGNSTDLGAHSLRYVQKKGDSFGGNLSLQKRLFYFDDLEEESEVPCGFFHQFPISSSDRIAMENCRGLVVASAVIGDHDKIRQPKGLGSKTQELVCFFIFVDETTLRRLAFHQLGAHRIGVWRIVKVSTEFLYQNPAMNGEIPKYLIHRLFPNTKHSIWIDSKLQLVIDPLLLIHALVVNQNVDMAISKHPFFLHTMEEVIATARWKKWSDINALRTQIETYCDHGLQPWDSTKAYPSDVPDSALILRKHSRAGNHFSCLMFNEMDVFNPRDQLPFAFVRDKMRPQIKIHMFEVEVFEQIAIEYRHNLKTGDPKLKIVERNEWFGNGTGSCDKYLYKMWGESHDR